MTGAGRGPRRSLKVAHPAGLERRQVEAFLQTAIDEESIGGRIDVLSRRFLGYPYHPNPLIGSPETAEVFTASPEGFDCVTYIETIVALARASDFDGFSDSLRHIRYHRGRIAWSSRNHYTTDWIRNNLREGILSPISLRAIPTITKQRVLNVVKGLPAREVRMKWLPKAGFPRLGPRLKTGDLIFFISTRKNLDVFHGGIVVRIGQELLMRHASRSQGGVVEQKIGEFLKANRMAGVIVVRVR